MSIMFKSDTLVSKPSETRERFASIGVRLKQRHSSNSNIPSPQGPCCLPICLLTFLWEPAHSGYGAGCLSPFVQTYQFINCRLTLPSLPRQVPQVRHAAWMLNHALPWGRQGGYSASSASEC